MWLAARARSGTLPVCLVLLGILAIIGLLPIDLTLRYVVILSMTTAIAAVGLDLFAGYLGQANFGQYAFVGLGAYAITILRAEAHLNVLLAVLITLAVAAALAAILGAAMVQLRHFGAALTTFFLAFVAFNVLTGNTLDPITHSETGLAVPSLSLGPLAFTSSSGGLYWLTWALLLGVVLVTFNYANGRAGRALRLVKHSEPVAGALGVRVRLVKLRAYVFAAVVAALAGLPLSLALGYLSPETFSPNLSITLFAMLVVGGIGSLAGPIIGAFFFTALPQELQSTGTAQALLFALIFLVFVIALPNGIYGLVERLVRRARPARRSAAAPADPAPAEEPAPVPAPPASGSGTVLAAEGVAVAFGGVRALDGVTFSVREGTIHALVGPNGAGKTTFLNCVTGLQRAGGGAIVVDGVDVRRTAAHAIRALGVSRTFQNPSLVADLTVVENVMLGLYGSRPWSLWLDLLGRWATAGRERAVARLAGDALRQVGLGEDRWDVPASDLSLGELKVVDVARAIAGGSRLLLLDEPTSGLGDQDVQTVARLLKRLRDEHGLTVLVVAHDVGFVQDISDAVTVLDFGRVLAEGAPDAVISDPEVVTAFLGSPVAVAT
jgi:branched-chain amino acid transport system permease protein